VFLMAAQILAIMRQKRATYNWFQQNNPVLADGQIGIINSGQNKNCFKVGDGVTAWNSLSWVTDYAILFNKPSINGVPLSGNMSPDQLGIASHAAISVEATARANADSTHAALTAAHSATATPAANRIAMYDAAGRLKSGAPPAADTDVARKAEINAEALARDAAIVAAQLNTQKWLTAVDTKAELPDPDSLARTVGYLCRVMNDPDAANKGVWQLVADADEWTFFSDNLDFVDETELQAAVAAEAALREAADTSLGNAIGAEAQARENAITQEAQARDAAIAGAVVTTLEDREASPALPSTSPSGFAGLLQQTRDNLKWMRDFGGGSAEIEEVLPPFFADRDGRLVSARGGTLIELNVTEQPEQQINEE
jgi:hypothetical protein